MKTCLGGHMSSAAAAAGRPDGPSDRAGEVFRRGLAVDNVARMLGGMTPIVRGKCDACGTTRNLW